MSQELIDQYMKELYEQTLKCSAECAATDKVIEELKHLLEIEADRRNKMAAPFEAAMDALREQIKALTLTEARSFDCGHGHVKYRKGGERRSWQLDSLDAVCAADAAVKEKIWPFRKVTTTDPSVTIELDV